MPSVTQVHWTTSKAVSPNHKEAEIIFFCSYWCSISALLLMSKCAWPSLQKSVKCNRITNTLLTATTERWCKHPKTPTSTISQLATHKPFAMNLEVQVHRQKLDAGWVVAQSQGAGSEEPPAKCFWTGITILSARPFPTRKCPEGFTTLIRGKLLEEDFSTLPNREEDYIPCCNIFCRPPLRKLKKSSQFFWSS